MNECRATTRISGVVLATISVLSGSADAEFTGFVLNYTSGTSVGIGMVTIDDSFLIPSQSLFDTGTFLGSLVLTFSNTGLPMEDAVSFSLADVGAAYLVTNESSDVVDLNIWTYDRLGLGGNTCASCTDVYLAGVGPLTATLTEPDSGMFLTYSVSITPIPEPTALSLFGFGLVVFGFPRLRPKQSQVLQPPLSSRIAGG